MNRSSSRYASSLLAATLLTVASASQAGVLSAVAPANVVGASASEAVEAFASRVLEPSLQPARSGITDATAPSPNPTPEPETLALFGLGLAFLVASKRRKADTHR